MRCLRCLRTLQEASWRIESNWAVAALWGPTQQRTLQTESLVNDCDYDENKYTFLK